MTEPGAPRVAVYLDFDNIVISRYDQLHGRNSFQRDKSAGFDKHPDRLATATVDVSAIIDFASSFGTLVLTRAYADWSADVILFSRASKVDAKQMDIWALPTSSDQRPAALLTSDSRKLGAKFSPDRRWIAYTSNESGRDEVYVQRRSGRSKRRWQWKKEHLSCTRGFFTATEHRLH